MFATLGKSSPHCAGSSEAACVFSKLETRVHFLPVFLTVRVCVCVCIFLSLRDVPSRDDLLKSSDMWVTVAQFYVPGNTWSELSALYEVRMVGLDTAGVGTQPNSCQVFSQCFFLPCFEKCSRGADLSPINIYSFKIEVGERRNGNNLTLLLLLLLFL